MDSFVRRIYFSVVGLLAVLLLAMVFLVVRAMKPEILSAVSAPALQPNKRIFKISRPFFKSPGFIFPFITRFRVKPI